MQLTGHRTPAIFRRNAITNEADLRDAVTRLAGFDGARQNAPTAWLFQGFSDNFEAEALRCRARQGG